ncbi:MAG TPA: hypothetical protein VIQ00_10445 [Chitinophagaceae bacterium]
MKFVFILLTFISFNSFAQTAEENVRETINKMFFGMKNVDTEMLKNSFADSVIFQTIQSKNGEVIIKNENMDEFFSFVGTQEKNALDEQITFGVVKVDGPLAIVWTPYKFYYNGKFTHCGVNSFQLVLMNGKWKIQYLIDTRRKEGCD